MSMSHIPEPEVVRGAISEIPDDRDRVLLETLYLTASRASELTTKTSPWALLHEQTRPYGIYLHYGFADFEVSPAKADKPAVYEKVFLITQACAKRQKGRKKEQQKQLTPEQIAEHLPELWRDDYLKKTDSVDPLIIQAFLGKMFFKAIALPTSKKYEVWTADLLHWIAKNKTLSFPMTRQRVWQIVKQYLKKIDPKVHPHDLRSWRLSHLMNIYNFDAVDISTVAGWTLRTSFGTMGIQGSPNMDIYIGLQWRRYFPRLLKEI
jgi:integrase